MTEETIITVISYISDRGALARMDPQHIPIPFSEGRSFSAKIELGSAKGNTDTYEFNFEFRKETPSATGKISPAMAVGIIEGLTGGPPSFKCLSIKEISENLAA